jgi:hypothetical protein
MEICKMERRSREISSRAARKVGNPVQKMENIKRNQTHSLSEKFGGKRIHDEGENKAGRSGEERPGRFR